LVAGKSHAVSSGIFQNLPALVAEVVGQAHDVAHLAERALVQVRILPRHAAAELGRLADGREHEEVEFHRPGV